jgi:hypothetical protein
MLRLTLAAPAAAPAAALAASLAFPAAAEPPAGALPLSEILRVVEEQEEVAFVERLAWSEEGHWRIAFVTARRASAELRMDPRTGLKVE